MLDISINKKNKYVVVKTDYPFSDFKFEKYHDKFHFSFIKNSCESMGFCLFYNQFNGRKYYPNEMKIENTNFENGVVELSYS